jgi:cell wall-associated NlpC family hydrolase
VKRIDPRLNAYRPDIADEALRGRVEAERFVAPRLMQAVEPVVPVHAAPRFDAMQVTQALLGEMVKLFDEQEGWAFVQLAADGYVGYVNANALSPEIVTSTHRVAVPATFLYPEPNLKTQPAVLLTMNAQLSVRGGSGDFSQIADGRFVFARHLKPLGDEAGDFVAVAELFCHVPYYWGGKSVQGLDCSGLVQLSLEACGIPALRDTDMQEATLGERLLLNGLDGLQRGDLVFWKGHVGIMTDGVMLLHANAHHMSVAAEPLANAVARNRRAGLSISAVKRIARGPAPV